MIQEKGKTNLDEDEVTEDKVIGRQDEKISEEGKEDEKKKREREKEEKEEKERKRGRRIKLKR